MMKWRVMTVWKRVGILRVCVQFSTWFIWSLLIITEGKTKFVYFWFSLLRSRENTAAPTIEWSVFLLVGDIERTEKLFDRLKFCCIRFDARVSCVVHRKFMMTRCTVLSIENARKLRFTIFSRKSAAFSLWTEIFALSNDRDIEFE